MDQIHFLSNTLSCSETNATFWSAAFLASCLVGDGCVRPFLLLFPNRKKASSAKCVANHSSAPPPCPHTCSSTRTRGPTPASTAAKGSTRSLTWRNTHTFTQVTESGHCVKSERMFYGTDKKLKPSVAPVAVIICFPGAACRNCFQE